MMPENLIGPIIFGCVFALLSVGHHVGDHWVQRGIDACRKQLPGRQGALHCGVHVATVTATKAAILIPGVLLLGLPVSWAGVFLALIADAGSHYLVDRGAPLRAMATAAGKAEYIERVTVVRTPGGAAEATGPGTGAFELDQSWHRLWVLIAALIIALASA